MKPLLLLVLGAMTAVADEQAHLIQPGFDRLIPTTYPVLRPNFSRLKVTTNSAQLIRPSFEKLIPSSYPTVRPDVAKFKVETYQANIPATSLRLGKK